MVSAAHVSISDCSICKHLPGSFSADYLRGEKLPEQAANLQPVSACERLRTCPECQTYYEFKLETGYGENDELVERLTASRALALMESLRGSFSDHEIANLRESLESVVSKLEVDLDHADLETKRYATRSFVEYWIEHDGHERIEKLLDQGGPSLRSEVLYALQLGGKNLAPLLSCLIARLKALQNTDSAGDEWKQISIILRRYIQNNDDRTKAVQELLEAEGFSLDLLHD